MARSPFLSNCSHQNCDKFSASKPFAVESFCIDCFRLRIFSKYDEVRRDGKGRRTDLFVCGTEQNHLYRRSIDVRSSFGLGPLVRGLPGEEEESSRTGTAQGKKKCLANSACANHLHLESGMTPRRQSIGVSCLHAVWAGI